MKRFKFGRIRFVALAVGGLIGLIGQAARSQVDEQWVSRYDGAGTGEDRPNSVAVDPFGNVYVTGQSGVSGSGLDFATIKYDSEGIEQWVRTYNGPGNSTDIATAMAVDGAGNVYVTGSSIGAGTSDEDYATIKYSSDGVEEWVARYNGPANSPDEPFAIAVDDDGNVYVTGRSNPTGLYFDFDYLTIKYDSLGDEQWVARYNGPGSDWDQARAIAVDAAGNVYVTGTVAFDVGTAYHNYGTVKYNSAGTLQWVRQYDGPGGNWDEGQSIALDASGDAYVTGFSVGSATGYDYATIKYSSFGAEEWVRRYNAPGGGIPHDIGTVVAVDGDGNAIVTGVSDLDYGTVKYDPSGTLLWEKRHGTGAVIDRPYSMAIDGAGDVYVTGTSVEDYVTIKYSSSGTQQWMQSYDGPASADDAASFLHVDSLGNVYVTGYSTGALTGIDYATVKYSQGIVGTDEPSGALPAGLALEQNQPNPFGPVTTIRIRIPEGARSHALLRVFDVFGREVATLVSGELNPGIHDFEWDASGRPSGTYFYRLEGDRFSMTRKMVLVR